MSLNERGFGRRNLIRNGAQTPPQPPQTLSPSLTIASASAMPMPEATVSERPRIVMSREVVELKYRIHERMIREIDPTRLTADLSPEEARRAVGDSVLQLLALEGANISRTDEVTL